jgi:hypothetical protein
MPSIEHEIEIGLLSTRRKSRRRAWTLSDMDHDRRLNHPRETHSLTHEGESAAGCRHKCSCTSIPGTDRDIDRRDLVFRLIDDDTELLRLTRQIGQHTGPWRHRI